MTNPTIALRLADGSFRVLRPANTIGHFRYLGLTDYKHDTLWMKFSVGVPQIDDEIISIVRTAEKMGYEPHPAQIEIFKGEVNE